MEKLLERVSSLYPISDPLWHGCVLTFLAESQSKSSFEERDRKYVSNITKFVTSQMAETDIDLNFGWGMLDGRQMNSAISAMSSDI